MELGLEKHSWNVRACSAATSMPVETRRNARRFRTRIRQPDGGVNRSELGAQRLPVGPALFHLGDTVIGSTQRRASSAPHHLGVGGPLRKAVMQCRSCKDASARSNA